MAHAKFAGIYESQVKARILRAWSLPDEPAPSPDFSCLVKILQRQDGRVREVDVVLDQCNGSGVWQKSLTDAIFRASPLPAPPHPSAFVDSFAIVFHSASAEISQRSSSH
jgi:colicin import membrane protein